ncbi:xylulokinase [Rhodobacterales bacterium 52_120_T64]|nr:xylulokinase [Rhodobacterales bacterium 52_120_T64]
MYLGLDLGTSGLKGLLMDEAQSVVGSASAPLEVSRPHDGWSEQDPDAWIFAAETVIDTLCKRYPSEMKALHGIGLSGQMHGATLVDRAGDPLRPCMLWNDTRSHTEAVELDSDPIFRSISGNIVFPGFTAPKILWVQRNEPQIFEQIYKVLLPKDYLRLWLTGEYISDMSDSAGTSWLDVAKRDWSDELLEKAGLTRGHMPELVEGSQEGGRLRSDLSARWNLPDNIVVAGGAGDNAASAIGMGTIHAGQSFVSLGTSGVLFAANDAYLPKPESAVHTFCHALPNTWHQMGVILSATDSLEWYGKIAGKSAQELTAELGDTLLPPSTVRFLPYLGGERTPHNDASIRGAFVGLSHSDDTATLTGAVLEGVAFALRDNLEALRAAGTDISRVLAVGGGSQSRYWLEVIATILEIPVDIPKDGEFGAAFGAARLGLLAATDTDPVDVCLPPEIAQTIDPNSALVPAFTDAYQSYISTYPSLKGI